MFVIDLLLEEVAKEIKDAPGWLTLIIMCNVLLGWDVVLHAIENLGFHIAGEEKALIATLAAIVLFLAGDIVDTLVFPRKQGAKRWKKIFQDIMLAMMVGAFFFLIEKRWKPLGWFVAIFVTLWVIQFVRSNYEKGKEELERKRRREERVKGAGTKPPATSPPEKFVGLLKHFQSTNLVTERDNAGKTLDLNSDQYAVSKSLATEAGKYNWTSIYFQNEAAKFLRSLIIPVLVTAALLFYRREWMCAVLGSGAVVGLLAIYFWLKESHMIRLYRRVQEIVKEDKNKSSDEQDSFAATLDNGRRVFFWKENLAGSGNAADSVASSKMPDMEDSPCR
jgi:hypothetical protein